MAAVVILVAVGLLVLGGLATGVAAAVGAPGSFGPGAGLTIAGSSIETGAEWADPLLAIVLLGVLGLCWWQVDGWSEATDDIDLSEVTGHIRRGRRIAWWVQGALIVTLAGSTALFAGLLLINSSQGNQSALVWSRDIYGAASVLAVAVIAFGGVWAGAQVKVAADGATLE